uniref:Tropinone reductase I n=1 Tax=Opuntia streptacantha TaxID=393608 RepID=A0A7C9DIT9_OPUST
MELQSKDSFPSTRWWGKETIGIVTGANRGIGFALAKTLAESGLTVILTARDANKGLQALEKLRSQGLGAHVHFSPLDVSQPDSIRAFAAWFKHSFGVLDILVSSSLFLFFGGRVRGKGRYNY